jgi:hypothetical protein
MTDIKIEALEKRVKKLEDELIKAIEAADKNRVHCINPKCNSINVTLVERRESDIYGGKFIHHYKCNDCPCEWETDGNM